jgi:predicted dehydrogenase
MRFLIVGLGSMGKRRIRCLKRLGFDEIVGFDPREDRCLEARQRYDVATISDWGQAAQEKVDAWIVSTPPDTHASYGLQAVDRGIPFFTEANVDEPEMPELVARLRDTGTLGAPSCTMRYYPGPQTIKAALAGRKIGKPLAFTYHSGQYLPDWHPWESYKDFYVSKRQTGACREIVPFELSWLTDLFGDVRELRCLKAKVTDLEADIDDIYQVLMEFDDGVMGHMMVDVIAQPAVRLFRLLGSEGTLVWDHTAGTIAVWTKRSGAWETTSLNPGSIEPGYIHAEEPYIAEMGDFVAAVRRERPWPHSYAEEQRVIALLLEADRSTEGMRVP